ncbi:hypothetical protein AB3N02_05015 [Priestia aryabhattai]|uniref:hypothetical protein n=1 Tax=Priestia TaxID=2800373 RepID=UPI00372D0B59
MARIINFWSFTFALLCGGLFFLAFNHPSLLYINFCLAIILFFIGIAGFFRINNWASALRSVLTVVIGGILILVTRFIIFIQTLKTSRSLARIRLFNNEFKVSSTYLT